MHATSVAIGPVGVLITGASGSGKSTLALALIGMGATLVSDDLTRVVLRNGVPVAHAPDRLAGVIEARGVGLLRVPYQDQVPVALIVDLDQVETERLPEKHTTQVLGCDVGLQRRVDAPHFATAVFNLAKGGRYA